MCNSGKKVIPDRTSGHSCCRSYCEHDAAFSLHKIRHPGERMEIQRCNVSISRLLSPSPLSISQTYLSLLRDKSQPGGYIWNFPLIEETTCMNNKPVKLH